MAFAEQTIADVEARAAANRMALSVSLADIGSRLRPANIVAAAKDEIARKASAVAGDFGQTIRKHGGEAALFGAGTILAFDLGRTTARHRRDPPSVAEAMASSAGRATPSGQSATWGPSSFSPPMNRSHGLQASVDRMKTWVTPLAGVALGYVAASALPRTRIETEALGTIGSDLREAVAAFGREHAQGAKQMAAEAFGIAKFTAAALGLMAAASRYFDPPAASNGEATPAERAANPSAHFETPDDVLRDDGMSRGQRADALDQMELDARLLQTAEDEGMGGGEPAAIAEVAETKAKAGVPPLPKPA